MAQSRSPIAPARTRANGPKTTTTAVLIALVVAVLCTVRFLEPVGWIGRTSYLTVIVGAAAFAWVSAHRRGGAVRVWLAVGIGASALGDVLWEMYVVIHDTEPDVSVADVAWIASYVAISVALLKMLRRGREGGRSDLDGLIDMAVIVLASVLLLWQFWLHSTFTDESVPLFVRSVWATYPILDATLLALVIRTLIERQARTIMAVPLAFGVACWLISDIMFMTTVPEGAVKNLLDIGWMLGATLMAVACWSDSECRVPDVAAAGQVHDGVGEARIALAIAPLLIPGVVETITYLQGYDPNPFPLLAATVVFAALVAARAVRLLHLTDEARFHLVTSERLFRALAANSSDAVLVLDADGWITNDAPALAELVGHPGVQTRGQRALDFVSDGDVDSRSLFDEALLSPGVVLCGEARIRRPDASEHWLSTRAVNLLHDPAVHGIVVNVHDITDRKQAEEELVHQAFHDSLTGLANRALFRDRVEHALRRRLRSGLDPAVIYLDLDGFKNVNDGLGHEAGDNMLREIATRLLAVVRSGDTVARLGGDEFAVLVEESGHVQVEAEAIAERALQSLTAPVVLGSHEITLSASLGIATGDADSTASSLLRDADVAMYQAKTTGKSRWVVYEPAMRASAIERLQLEGDLAHAVDGRQLRLVYQPVVELETNCIVGFEALVRWDHPELGTIMPDRFIPLAEDNGTIISIGRWVLREACRTAAGWLDRYPRNLTMAVNLSGRQLAAPELFADVRNALRDAGLDPAALVLEMTETALVKDPVLAASKLHELRKLGVRLAIDDFGTGYSSLSYLRQFPLDILKIDRSFISTITDRDNIPAIVRGLLDLGRTLQLETIAEGIESVEQLGQLRDQHCLLGQGFLFARPLPPEEAEQLLESVSPLGDVGVPC